MKSSGSVENQTELERSTTDNGSVVTMTGRKRVSLASDRSSMFRETSPSCRWR